MDFHFVQQRFINELNDRRIAFRERNWFLNLCNCRTWVTPAALSRLFKSECKTKVCKEFYMYNAFEISTLKDLTRSVFSNDKMNLKDTSYAYLLRSKVINMKLESIEKLERTPCKKHAMTSHDWKIFIQEMCWQRRDTARSNCEYIHEYSRHLIQTDIPTSFLLLL